MHMRDEQLHCDRVFAPHDLLNQIKMTATLGRLDQRWVPGQWSI